MSKNGSNYLTFDNIHKSVSATSIWEKENRADLLHTGTREPFHKITVPTSTQLWIVEKNSLKYLALDNHHELYSSISMPEKKAALGII